MTIDDLIRNLQTKRAAALEKRATHTVALAELRGQEVKGEEIDPATVESHRAAKSALDADVAGFDARIAELEVEKAADEAATRAQADVTPTGVRKPAVGDGVIGAEKRTYSPDTDKRGGGFLRDLALAMRGNGQAQARLNAHSREEEIERGQDFSERAAGTGAFAGLVVPQYLTDLYAPKARAMRPFADACTKYDLPESGMTVNISRITTGTTVAIQTENAAVSETNIDDTLLTLNVLTIAGQQTLSRQAIERGTGVEAAMLDDLFRAYASKLDDTLLNQATSGFTNAVNASNTVAYTDASPTAAEAYPKLLDARQRAEVGLLDAGDGDFFLVMHPRRWAWFQSQVGPNWPFLAQANQGPMNGGADYGMRYGSGYRGVIAGMPVVVDANITTAAGAGTEDEIYVGSRECILWEDPKAPVLIRAEQPAAASLGVLFVVSGYVAFTVGGRYGGEGDSIAVSLVGGTGLIAPTF
jgi:hypothetical protein